MKQKEILASLKGALEDISPDFSQMNAYEKAHPGRKTEIILMQEERKNNNSSVTRLFPKFAALVASVAICIFAAFGYTNHLMTDSIIDIDINPSVEITANRSDKVLKVTALNEDGATVLDNMDLKGVDLNVAVNAITGSMVKKGYLNGNGSDVLVSVQNKDASKALRLKEMITDDIGETLAVYNIEAGVINQVVEEASVGNQQTKAAAESYNISYGKTVFIEKLIGKDPSLTYDMLAPMSIRQIASLIDQRGIDVSDFADYERDESTAENVGEAIEEYNEANPGKPAGNDDKYCEYCGKLLTDCGGKCPNYGKGDAYDKYCDDCGRLDSECRDTCDDKPYTSGSGNSPSGVGSYCSDRYCEYCGKLLTECGRKCADYGKGDAYEKYCDDCGRLESVCRDSCDDDNDDDDYDYGNGGSGSGSGSGYRYDDDDDDDDNDDDDRYDRDDDDDDDDDD